MIAALALPLVSSTLSMLAPGASAAATAAAQGAASAGGDFGQVLSKVASDALHSVKSAESVSLDGLQGKANVQTVVHAVMSAEESLQTALAIRDKSVAAFQEITRMAI